MTKLLCWAHLGDSISASVLTWPYQFMDVPSRGDSASPIIQNSAVYTNSGNTVIFKNMAIAGTRLANANGVETIGPTYVDPIYAVKATAGTTGGTVMPRARKYLVSCAIGSNDGAIAAYGTATLYAVAVAAEMAERRAAGADLIALCTLLPRGDATMTELNRLEYNGRLTNSAWRLANGVDYVIDLASETTMGNPLSVVNATYYSDLVHPTTAGQALLVSNVVNAAMAQIISDIG